MRWTQADARRSGTSRPPAMSHTRQRAGRLDQVADVVEQTLAAWPRPDVDAAAEVQRVAGGVAACGRRGCGTWSSWLVSLFGCVLVAMELRRYRRRRDPKRPLRLPTSSLKGCDKIAKCPETPILDRHRRPKPAAQCFGSTPISRSSSSPALPCSSRRAMRRGGRTSRTAGARACARTAARSTSFSTRRGRSRRSPTLRANGAHRDDGGAPGLVSLGAAQGHVRANRRGRHADDAAWVQRHREAFVVTTSLVGDPPTAIRNLWMDDVVRVSFDGRARVRPDAGPDAGRPL